LDELFEILTLAQTQKLAKKILVLIYGKEYWSRVLNLDALVDAGTVAPEDLNLFRMVDTPEEGFRVLRDGLTKYHLQPVPRREKEDEGPDIAQTRSSPVNGQQDDEVLEPKAGSRRA
jgi:predicted Rossmann-fold nucleotide-binding protein